MMYLNKSLLIFMILQTNLLFGQQLGDFLEVSQSFSIPFTVRSYGTKHGLPQNQVLSIIPKKDGELLISTANGIVEYNGLEFYPFIENETYKKYAHHRLYWNKSTEQLFGTELGGSFNRVHPNFQAIEDLRTASISNDTIYGINDKGDIKAGSLQDLKFEILYQTGIQSVEGFLFTKEFVLLSSSKQGLYIFNLKSKLLHKISTEVIYTIRKNPNSNKIYLLSLNRLFELTNEFKLIEIDLEHDTNAHVFSSIEFINETDMLIGGSKGLFFLAENYVDLYSKSNFLPTDYIQSLFYDKKEDCLFVGTGNKGLLKLSLKHCSTLNKDSRISGMSLSSIIRNHEGKVLVAGSDNNVYEIGMEGTSIFYNAGDQLASLTEIDKTLFLGTWGNGVQLVKDKRNVGYIKSPQLANNVVHSVFQDSRKKIWIGNTNGVSTGYKSKDIKPFLSNKIDRRIIAIYELRNGDVCLGGSAGVFIVDRKNHLHTFLGKKEGITGKEVRSFYEDDEGKLWIGTYGGGLYCYYNKRLTSINKKLNCQLNIDVFTLAKGGNGFIYMTSNSGLFVIEEKKLNDFYYGRLDCLIPFFYGNESGIVNTEFNGGFQNNYLKSSHSHFYFPSIEGVVLVNEEKYLFRKLIPNIKSVRVNGIEYKEVNPIFDRTTYGIEFSFYSPNYVARYNVYYQTKLSGPGLPENWGQLQKNNTISYSMLPPGKYVFSVRSIDAFNDAKPYVKSYSFEIASYFYETWWFYILLTILVLFMIFLIIRLRIYQTKLRERKNNRINNTILELKLKAIQSKMNPHFIFNALNNIIYLLNTQKYIEAEKLVEDFSLLLRQFLENSDQTFSTVKDELTIIDLYLAIEKRRYNDLFDYEIHCDENIEKNTIPTLLIQPFVENAVKHGVAHSYKKCTILIKVFQNNGSIEIYIIDNGIGRKRSSEINRGRSNHNPKGIQLVKDKIEIVGLKYDKIIVFEIFDNPHETGTSILIKIPFHD